MASNVIRATLLADASKFKSGLGEAERALGTTETKMGGFGGTLDKTAGKMGAWGKAAVAGLGLAAGAAVIGFLGDATKAALEDEEAQRLLALALENTTGATSTQIGITEEWIDATARATGIADDELRPALANLARATGDVEEAQDLLAIAMDISTAKGIPLETITTAIGKAAQGNVGALGRMGIATRDLDGKVLSFEEVMAEANRTMGGATEEASKTGAGALRRLEVSFEETKEEIGKRFIPMLAGLADAVEETLAALAGEGPAEGTGSFAEEQIGDFREWGDAIAGVAAEFEDFFIRVGLVDEAVGDAAVTSDTYLEVLKLQRQALVDTTPALQALDGELDETAESTDVATTALERYKDEVKSQSDPLYALVTAHNDVTAALADVVAAEEEFGTDSPEYVDAVLKVAQANEDLTVAQLEVAEQSGLTADEYRTNLENMGNLTKDQIDVIIAEFQRVNAFNFKEHLVVVNGKIIGFGMPRFHSGGVVPGPPGAEVPILAQAGETVIPAGRSANGHGGGTVINLTVTSLDPAGAARLVVQALQSYERSNGAIPVRVRQP